MILIPQIYLKNGKVLLHEGTTSPLISEDPFATARSMKDSGAEAIHIVDLGITQVGAGPHLPTIKRIHDELGLACYIGGGFKTVQAIESYISAGIEIVALGSVAYQQPAFLEEACKKFPARVATHIDVKAGRVTIPGYTVAANKTAFDYAERFVKEGVRYIFYSEVGGGGAMADEHYEKLGSFCKSVTARVVCTSEVGSLAEIERIAGISVSSPRLEGLSLGKPLFEGKFDLRSAVAMVNDIMLASGDESTLTEM